MESVALFSETLSDWPHVSFFFCVKRVAILIDSESEVLLLYSCLLCHTSGKLLLLKSCFFPLHQPHGCGKILIQSQNYCTFLQLCPICGKIQFIIQKCYTFLVLCPICGKILVQSRRDIITNTKYINILRNFKWSLDRGHLVLS